MFKKGFTFIEVIIIFTIVFIMTAVMMSMSFKDRAKKVVDTSAREIVASIRETQNNALTGKQKDNAQLPCDFTFNMNDNAYSMTATMRDVDGSCDEGETITMVPSTELLPGVSVTVEGKESDTSDTWSEVSKIMFDVPYGKITFIDTNATDTEYDGVEIVVEKDGNKYYICVHAIGLVEELGRMDIDEGDHACQF